MLLGYQMAAICTAAAFSFVGTYIILFVLNKTIGIRVSATIERTGLDSSLHGGDSYTQSSRSLNISPRNNSSSDKAAETSAAEPSSVTQV